MRRRLSRQPPAKIEMRKISGAISEMAAMLPSSVRAFHGKYQIATGANTPPVRRTRPHPAAACRGPLPPASSPVQTPVCGVTQPAVVRTRSSMKGERFFALRSTIHRTTSLACSVVVIGLMSCGSCRELGKNGRWRPPADPLQPESACNGFISPPRIPCLHDEFRSGSVPKARIKMFFH